MRRTCRAVSVALLATFLALGGCGESSDGNSNGAGQASGGAAGSASGATAAGKGGVSAAGTTSGAAASGGTSAGGIGGAAASDGGAGTGMGEAGGESSGGAGGLVVCDPKQVFCKSLPQDCPDGQVPSVEGICWGPCVKIEQCACAAAGECPDPDQYTCWAKQHCGFYVE